MRDGEGLLRGTAGWLNAIQVNLTLTVSSSPQCPPRPFVVHNKDPSTHKQIKNNVPNF